MTGLKFDSEKPRMDLLPPKAIFEVAKVLGFGAEKYGPENWRLLDNLQGRYTAGALRHIFAHMDGEELDPESGTSHLAHALCCLLFKLEVELENAKIEEEEPRESDEQQHQARDQSFESDRLYEADNKERSVQHIKHLVQYYTS